jgi:dipeptidyl aminopeptidase/acylaminoacyl peptidase
MISVRSAFVAAAVFGTVAGAQTSPPPIQAFAQLPQIVAPSISPDGNHLAALQPYEGKLAAVIYNLSAAGGQPIVIPFEDGHVVGVQFAKNDRVLITTEQYVRQDAGWAMDDLHAWYRTISIGLNGENGVRLMGNLKSVQYNYSASSIVDLAPDDPQNIYVELWAQDVRYIDSAPTFTKTLFKVDVHTGNAVRSDQGSSHTAAFVTDGSGAAKARLDIQDVPLQAELWVKNDADWKIAETADASKGEVADLVGLTSDGKSVVRLMADSQNGRQGLYARPLTGGPDTLLYADPKFDVDSALHDPWTHRVIGATVSGDGNHDVYFDPELMAMQRGLEAAFPAYAVHAESWDRARQKVVVLISAPRQPTAYFVLDRTTHKIEKISSSYPDLHSADLGRVTPYTYKARDGLDIPAFITMPPGKESAKNLPAVVLVHGGPAAHDVLGFDWMAQFLASRGYVVLQPNFRGSTGYGRAFEEAGYGEWGGKMQDDVSDGVKKLIADGIADPKRICIAGGSYGGYAALAGATLTPDLYACAASWAGVSDLSDLAATASKKNYGNQLAKVEWERYIGSRWSDASRLSATSPVNHAGNARVPILLMHGSSDTRVLPDQSRTMASALRSAGKTVTYIEIKGETHHLQTEEARVRWLTELEKLLAQTIGR